MDIGKEPGNYYLGFYRGYLFLGICRDNGKEKELGCLGGFRVCLAVWVKCLGLLEFPDHMRILDFLKPCHLAME